MTVSMPHTGNGTAILRGHPSHEKVKPFEGAKAAPSFFSYLKTLSIGPAPRIGPGISRSAIQSPTALANGTSVG